MLEVVCTLDTYRDTKVLLSWHANHAVHDSNVVVELVRDDVQDEAVHHGKPRNRKRLVVEGKKNEIQS